MPTKRPAPTCRPPHWWGRRFRLPIRRCGVRASALPPPFWAVCLTPLLLAAAHAQVLAPEEIRDPQLRALQEKYRSELKQIPQTLAAHEFPYRFYFSRRLDLAEKDQPRNDQRSVQFDRYQGKVVLKITGNYFASYSAELMKPEERARETYQEVMLPLLRAAVRALENADAPQAFAFEVSHHVRRRVLGISSESVENVVLVLPKASAERLLNSADPRAQQTALFEGQVFLNAKPISLWPRPESTGGAGDLVAGDSKPPSTAAPAPVNDGPVPTAAAPAPTVSARLLQGITVPGLTSKTPAEPGQKPAASRDSSPQALKELQKSYQSVLDRMVQELERQAHFIRYAPPTFIAFHNGIYLQLSLTTTLPQGAAGSQYRLAALAFDQHVAHLIRPVYAYFKDSSDFDGIDFSATVRLSVGEKAAGEQAAGEEAGGSPLAVEFLFPLPDVKAYAGFDCTGQQLIDGSYVLINGERAGLNLQAAEAGAAVQ
jgi:hypothetical protein